MLIRDRVAGELPGDFVVFLIGMRINNPLLIHKWLPVVAAMPRMIKELSRQPELGLLHAESWFARTLLMVQYWRSMDQLMAYATNREAEHLPAWKAFNQAVGTNGTVGIWHETYDISPGRFESVYVNMPRFGLGKAGSVVAASGNRTSARGRLGEQQTGLDHPSASHRPDDRGSGEHAL